MSAASRPVPVPDEQSRPYWEAAANHVLALARCGECGQCCHPPDLACPHCHTTDPRFEFIPVDGDGVVRSWTVMRQSFLPGFAGEVPFVLVDVALAAQPEVRLIGRLLDGPTAPLAIDARVQVEFEDVAPSVAVAAFRLADSA